MNKIDGNRLLMAAQEGSTGSFFSDSPVTSAAEVGYKSDSMVGAGAWLGGGDRGIYLSLPEELNIFRGFFEKINSLSSPEVKNGVLDFIVLFQRVLSQLHLSEGSGYLPRAYLNEIEEGTALVQWSYKDFSVVFSFSKNEGNSWHLVSSKTGGTNHFGTLTSENSAIIIRDIVQFVLNNI